MQQGMPMSDTSAIGMRAPSPPSVTRKRVARGRLGGIPIEKTAGSLLWIELYLLAVFGFLRDLLGVPSTITYLFDAINLFLFGAILIRGRYDNRGAYYTYLYGLMLTFLALTVVGGLRVGTSPLQYLWGLRNTFRFYAFFVCCVTLLGVRDVLRMVTFFKVLFLVNVGLCSLELAMGFSGDYIGGSFGVLQGGNGYLNILIAIATVIYVLEYLARKASFLKLVVMLLLCFYLVAIAELKVYFFELPIIVLLGILSERMTSRSATLVIVMVVGIVVGLGIMQFFFNGSGLSFFTDGTIFEYMGDAGYTGTGDLSRLDALSRITAMFFSNDPLTRLFGFGLGNCSTSSFEVLMSSFYDHFSWLHYTWFSDAYVYIETGLSGLMCFEAFFLGVFVVSKMKRYRDADLRVMTTCCSIVALLSVWLSVYNSSLTVESGYLVYLLLAVPFILDKYRRHGGVSHERQLGRQPPHGVSSEADPGPRIEYTA